METPSTFGKNLVINSHLSAGGNIHIGDITYNVHEDFAHSILFLSITRSGAGHVANLSLKTKQQRLRDQAVGMLQQTIELQIPDSLFRQVDQFQASRRKLEGNRYHNAYGMEPIVLEATLSQLLFDHFFAGDIGEVVRNFLQALEARKITELLLVIASPEEDIRNLPWEMVLDRLVPQEDGVLPLQGFGLVRTMEQNLDGFNLSGIPIEAAPLKMLFVTALPEDLPEKSKNLELEDEQKKLIHAVGALEATGDNKPKMVIEFLDVASLSEIKAALQVRHHDVVHISGHGQFVADLEQGFLYLETDEGDTSKTEGAELAAVLRGLGHLKLLVLSACETAMAGKGGTAEVLATSGIPAVLAMRFSVLDAGAKAFTTAFYTALANGRSITESMAAGRAMLLEQVQTHREYEPEYPAEWFTPVLYLNQYVAELVDVSRYQFHQDFYTHGQFLKEAHTRLIGSGFIGRKKQRIQMRRAFQDRKAVCLVGMGGMGKTTLAEAFARNYGNQSHRIIIWRGENEITELGILNRIVEEFRIWQPASPLMGRLKGIVGNAEMPILERLGYLLRNCLAGEKVILIFDNFEDLLWQEGDADARTIVDDGVREMLNCLLVKAPEHCRVMFTSRYRIEGLVGDVFFLDLDKLSLAEQYRLMNFSEVLRGIPASERDHIYTRLDGLPRAFTFLEGLVRNDPAFSFRDLEAQLDSVRDKVIIDLMLERIYRLLSDELQRVFLVTSVFFTRTLVEVLVSVTGDEEVLAKLEILRDWGLCFFDLEKAEFEVHALTREWVVKTELLGKAERKRVALRAGEWFGNEPRSEDEYLLSMDYYGDAEEWDIYADAAIRIIVAYTRFGLFRKGLELSRYVLSRPISELRASRILSAEGEISRLIGSHSDSSDAHSRSIELSKESGDLEGEIAGFNNLGRVLESRGSMAEANKAYRKALKIAEKIKKMDTAAIILSNIGMNYHMQGMDILALESLGKSMNIRREIGDKEGQGNCLSNISTIYATQGKYKIALLRLQESLCLFKELGNNFAVARTLCNFGEIYSRMNDSISSMKYYQECLVLRQQIFDKQGQGTVLANMSAQYQTVGDYENAVRCISESIEIRKEIGDKLGLGHSYHLFGTFLFATKNFPHAFRYFSLSYEILKVVSPHDAIRPLEYMNHITQLKKS